MSALQKIVGEAESRTSLSGESATLVTRDPKALLWIRSQIRDRHIRTSARRQLIVNRTGRTTTLMLNRQAAAEGVVALCGAPEESPLGPIFLNVESDSLERLIEWISAYSEG
jgi:predicted RNA binding protein with dsRBD fold (UPF0201 family)